VLEKGWERSKLLLHTYKNRHGINTILLSMFGGSSERYLEDSLGMWFSLVVETRVNREE
jgi:hypothetical protein